MKRIYAKPILKDLERKAVLLAGPRQCGKTYLSKRLMPESFEYLNYDIAADRKKLLRLDWDRLKDLVIFDEIHKKAKWKSWLKGIFDSDQEKQKFLVTGSAKLNTFKKVGDSLAGRYFSHRLYPFDVKEVLANDSKDGPPKLKKDSREICERLLAVSGFPEPFIEGSTSFYNRWQQTHLDIILKQDILESGSVKDIRQLETLALLLPERVASPVSYNSLREDLGTDDKSVKRWVDILENAYVVFRVFPYTHKSMIHGLKKAPKIYFFDYIRIEDLASRFENLVAFSLLKEIHYRKDILGENFDLHFVRNKQQKEIDFLITKNKKPHLLIEVKESDEKPSENFKAFERFFRGVPKIQLVRNASAKKLTREGVLIVPAHEWLAKMDF